MAGLSGFWKFTCGGFTASVSFFRSALAEERHVALQSATSNVDTAAASLGRLLEQETQVG